jgi:tRNA U34 2-thiouridine synthase MnmA/TrmU
MVKIRHSHEGADATLHPLEGGRIRVELDEPQRAITPGQAAVFYDKESTVMGGGWIVKNAEWGTWNAETRNQNQESSNQHPV